MAKTVLAKVVRHGEKLTLPEKMTYKEAIQVLQRQEEYEEQVIVITERVDGFVWDAAIAMNKAMEELFGFTQAQAQQSFFGEDPPKMISVDCGIKEDGTPDTVRVQWGNFKVPGVTGTIQTKAGKNEEGKVLFEIVAQVKRKNEETIKRLAERTREILKSQSIYRSKAVKIRWTDENGGRIPIGQISFVDLRRVNENGLIFSEEVNTQIKTNLFTPILHTEQCVKSGIPIKRGILLAGKYGTGKTLAAMVTAKHAVKNGWTFVYLEEADDLAKAIDFAKMFEPCVIFSEDIDRIATTERTDDANDVLNTLDGVLSKNSQIMVVFTTNHVENINTAMFRPGRLDAVITVEPPDAEAAERLVRLYAGEQIGEGETLEGVGEALKGKIPAIIRECVERSKLYAISIATEAELRKAEGKPKITAKAILEAAQGMQYQLQLLTPAEPKQADPFEILGNSIGKHIEYGLNNVKIEYNN